MNRPIPVVALTSVKRQIGVYQSVDQHMAAGVVIGSGGAASSIQQRGWSLRQKNR